MLELFETPLTVLHIFVCFFLILVVLIQPGKSGGLGAALGGAGATQVFGGRGAGNFLSKATWASATTFFLTSVVLAYISSSADDSLESRTGVASIAPAKNDAAKDDKENVAPANAEDTALEEGAANNEGAANDNAPAEPVSPEPPVEANEQTPNATAAGAANVVVPNSVASGASAPRAPNALTPPKTPAVGRVTPPAGATAVAPRPPVVPTPVVPQAAKPVVPVPPVSPVKPAANPSPAAPPPTPPAAP